jgi:hypothetical protein
VPLNEGFVHSVNSGYHLSFMTYFFRYSLICLTSQDFRITGRSKIPNDRKHSPSVICFYLLHGCNVDFLVYYRSQIFDWASKAVPLPPCRRQGGRGIAPTHS